jgi:iron complex transport system substrate-binding protein
MSADRRALPPRLSFSLSRRGLLLLGGGAAVLAACGGDDSSPSDGATGSSEPAGASAQSGGAQPRTVTHAMGETTVPAEPMRVVTLDYFGLEACLALGVPVVGAVMPGDIDDRPFLTGRLDGVANLGTPGQPNLERALTLRPDLILGLQGSGEIYPQLSAIAPTVLASFKSSGEWKAVFRKHAEALGKTAEAEQVMARYDQRVAELRDRLGDRLHRTTVSVVRVHSDSITLYLSGSFVGTIIDDVGLPRPAAQTAEGFSAQISRERFRDADADVIFLWSYGATAQIARDAQAAREQVKADPLWSQLAAVRQGRVYDVPGYWIGSGILAANAVLDDLFKHLT